MKMFPFVPEGRRLLIIHRVVSRNEAQQGLGKFALYSVPRDRFTLSGSVIGSFISTIRCNYEFEEGSDPIILPVDISMEFSWGVMVELYDFANAVYSGSVVTHHWKKADVNE